LRTTPRTKLRGSDNSVISFVGRVTCRQWAETIIIIIIITIMISHLVEALHSVDEAQRQLETRHRAVLPIHLRPLHVHKLNINKGGGGQHRARSVRIFFRVYLFITSTTYMFSYLLRTAYVFLNLLLRTQCVAYIWSLFCGDKGMEGPLSARM
jgi:hypothetical protein